MKTPSQELSEQTGLTESQINRLCRLGVIPSEKRYRIWEFDIPEALKIIQNRPERRGRKKRDV